MSTPHPFTSPTGPRVRIGSKVSGADFFDRKDEIRSLLTAVETGDDVLLSAPRRTGKSSLVGELCSRLKGKNWFTIAIDAQGMTEEVQFVEALIRGLHAAGLKIPWYEQVEGWVRRLRRAVGGTSGKIVGVEVQIGKDEPTDWADIGVRIVGVLREAAAKPDPILIVVDELPIFLTRLAREDRGPVRVGDVLRWLREARHAGKPAVRWVVCGSIGLDSFVEARGLTDTINDFRIQTLAAFDDAVAVEFLQALAAGKNLTLGDAACRVILGRVGWALPYYLQLMVQSLVDLRDEKPTATDFPTDAHIDAAFQQLLQPQKVVQFRHWDTRLDDQFSDPADAGIARFLLVRLCTQPAGVARDALFQAVAARQPQADVEALDRRMRTVLSLLERDGYLLRRDQTYAFRSFLLREYWRVEFA